MTKLEVADFFRRKGVRGVREDQWGNFVLPDGKTRYHLGKATLRKEAKYSDGGGWMRLASGYYGKLHVTEAGKLAGLSL